jgi:hypothetical protein
MAGPDTGLVDPPDPMPVFDPRTYAMRTCGVSRRSNAPCNLLFPAPRRIVVCVSSFFGAADDASVLKAE